MPGGRGSTEQLRPGRSRPQQPARTQLDSGQTRRMLYHEQTQPGAVAGAADFVGPRSRRRGQRRPRQEGQAGYYRRTVRRGSSCRFTRPERQGQRASQAQAETSAQELGAGHLDSDAGLARTSAAAAVSGPALCTRGHLSSRRRFAAHPSLRVRAVGISSLPPPRLARRDRRAGQDASQAKSQ